MLLSTTNLRLALLLGGVMALTSGCFDSLRGSELASGDSGGGQAPEPGDEDGFAEGVQCEVPSDCVLAASTCCECPSFAAPIGEGYDAGCDAVDCEESNGVCPAVEATCDSGECVMICSPIQTDRTCSFGFVRDDAGCLTNACAAPESEITECESDTDCVQIPADCCGCENGGQDKAAAAADADGMVDDLNCPPNPACPGVDVCDATQVPRCITGACVLSDESVNPKPNPASTQLCGTPQLEACSDGSVCTLNEVSSKEANDLGVGSCSAE